MPHLDNSSEPPKYTASMDSSNQDVDIEKQPLLSTSMDSNQDVDIEKHPLLPASSKVSKTPNPTKPSKPSKPSNPPRAEPRFIFRPSSLLILILYTITIGISCSLLSHHLQLYNMPTVATKKQMDATFNQALRDTLHNGWGSVKKGGVVSEVEVELFRAYHDFRKALEAQAGVSVPVSDGDEKEEWMPRRPKVREGRISVMNGQASGKGWGEWSAVVKDGLREMGDELKRDGEELKKGMSKMREGLQKTFGKGFPFNN